MEIVGISCDLTDLRGCDKPRVETGFAPPKHSFDTRQAGEKKESEGPLTRVTPVGSTHPQYRNVTLNVCVKSIPKIYSDH